MTTNGIPLKTVGFTPAPGVELTKNEQLRMKQKIHQETTNAKVTSVDQLKAMLRNDKNVK